MLMCCGYDTALHHFRYNTQEHTRVSACVHPHTHRKNSNFPQAVRKDLTSFLICFSTSKWISFPYIYPSGEVVISSVWSFVASPHHEKIWLLEPNVCEWYRTIVEEQYNAWRVMLDEQRWKHRMLKVQRELWNVGKYGKKRYNTLVSVIALNFLWSVEGGLIWKIEGKISRRDWPGDMNSKW